MRVVEARRRLASVRDAEEWILDSSGSGAFAFESICEVLGFSPAYVREGLVHWKEKMLAAHKVAKTATH